MVLIGSLTDHEPESTSVAQACISVDNAEKECVAHGADLVYVLDNTGMIVPRADIYATALGDVVLKHSPMLVLFALTDFGRELASRTAMISNTGLIADCADLRIEKNGVVATCPSWGGEIMAEITFSDGTVTGLATVQPHAFHAVKVSDKPCVIKRIQVDCPDTHKGLKLLSSSTEPEEHNKLEEADVVIVGGAGVGNIDGFVLVRELAAALGGEVGATRPPVFQHWVDEERLIGQTGKTVRPKLLFSIGTSGAIQYTAGIMESKTIVAINRDQNSPIFQVADLGIVADAGTFLPLLTAKVNQVVMRKMADVLYEDNEIKTDAGFGAKMRKLRESHDWSQEALAQATGQTPDFIEQVENNEFSPSVSFLLRLADALNVERGTFLRKEEEAIIQGRRAKAFSKRTRNYSYQTLTPGAESDRLRAFMVKIESRQTHKPVEYKHEGEEFIFVMEGDLELIVGSKTHNLKPGESTHFNSDIPHKLKSLSNEPTHCLVVLYTP
jgi:electron transfer flavoprotein alpha subunit/transcriptional regulator with XRE-family HTH domain